MAKSYSTFSDMAASNFASISGPTKSSPTKTATTSSKPSTKGGRGIMSAPVSSGDDGGGSTPTKQRVSQQSPAIGLGVYVAEQGAKTNSGDEKGVLQSWYDWAFGSDDEDGPIITPDAETETLQEDAINSVLSDKDFPLDPRTNLPVGALPRQRYVMPTDPLDLASLEGSTQGFNPPAIATGLEVVQALDVDAKARATDTSVSTQAYAVGDLREAQAQLKDLNLYRSTVDGLGGRQTANAIKTFQYRAGIPVTGELDTATREALGSTDIPRDQRPEDFSDPLLAVLSEGENTTYSSANDYDSRRGRPAWGVYGSYYSDRYNKPISEMTIGEIMDIQSGGYGNREVFAVGAYQVIPNTMRDTVERMGISEDTVFDAETQNAIGRDLLLNKPGRGNLRAYLLGEEGASEEAALLDLAKEWASMPVPSTGDSYYEGQSAHVPLAEVRQALREQRNIIMKEYGRTFESEE